MKKTKKSKSKKALSSNTRNVTIFARISPVNKKFIRGAAIFTRSDAHFVDALLSYARTQMSLRQIKGLFDGTKTRNNISSKVSKKAQAAA